MALDTRLTRDPAELDAIYRFRFQVYYGELGARLPEDTIRTGRLRCDLDDVAYQYASFENGQVVGCVRVVDLKDIRQDNALIAKYRLHEVINTWGDMPSPSLDEWRSQKNSEIGYLPFAS